jgi:outer membrane lipoprotein-sorting protein
MPEFKFSCPQCSQRIQCDSAYAGAQINCPGCQQSITVPPASAAASPPPVLPPSAPPPAKKSHTLRNILVVTACVIFICLAGLAAFGWVAYSKLKAKQVIEKKGNPAAVVAAPTAAQHQAALALLSKMQNAYTNLNALEVSGTSIMALDMSQLTAADLNPSAKKTKKTHRPSFMPMAITNTMQLSIKLERPGSYYVLENSHMVYGFTAVTNLNVTWSRGDTIYSFFLMNNGTFKRYTTVEDRDTALMAGGQPSLLAMGMMKFFFADAGNTPQIIQNLGQTEDEVINGQDCYTLTAKIFGQKIKIWASKSSYMILQSQLTLGAPVSDTDLEAAFKSFNTSTNMSAAKLTQEKAQVKQQATMMTKIRGTITDTCDDVQANPALTPDDFQYRVPRGTKLVSGRS